jgi:kumamolisin
MQKAFGVELTQQKIDGGTFRVRQGEICLPEELSEHVQAVLGLDNRPQAKPHFRPRGVAKPNASNISFTPVQVGQLYGFPAGAKAAGQTIGIIELGGGYRTADLTTYFKGLGLPVPAITTVSVGGAKNTPGTANGADGEVMLDVEVCAAIAVGAKIVVYFAPNTDQGFTDAITTAVHDAVNKPSVVSISWGGPESSWTAQAMTAMDQACQAAAVMGVTITVACGDNGSTDGAKGTTNHVDFPASSPHVLACGGTKLVGSGTQISSEVVWNEIANGEGATGGGVSVQFPLPPWQANANVPKPSASGGGRGVPDVTGDADPATGYEVRVDGQNMVIGGTSAVAPLWAGLIALANQQNGKVAGFVNPALYAASAKKAFRDITQGNNGGFSAGPGWDACSGLGSPVGKAVISAVAPPATTTTKPTAPKTAAAKPAVRRKPYASKSRTVRAK